MEHPFEDSAKLRILNAKYTIPENDRQYTVFHNLISKWIRILRDYFNMYMEGFSSESASDVIGKRVLRKYLFALLSKFQNP